MLLQSKIKNPKFIEEKKKQHDLWMTVMNVKYFGEKSVKPKDLAKIIRLGMYKRKTKEEIILERQAQSQ